MPFTWTKHLEPPHGTPCTRRTWREAEGCLPEQALEGGVLSQVTLQSLEVGQIPAKPLPWSLTASSSGSWLTPTPCSQGCWRLAPSELPRPLVGLADWGLWFPV